MERKSNKQMKAMKRVRNTALVIMLFCWVSSAAIRYEMTYGNLGKYIPNIKSATNFAGQPEKKVRYVTFGDRGGKHKKAYPIAQDTTDTITVK